MLQVILGERKTRPAVMDQELAQAILAAQTDKSFETRLGGTMCTDDFYEGVQSTCTCSIVVGSSIL